MAARQMMPTLTTRRSAQCSVTNCPATNRHTLRAASWRRHAGADLARRLRASTGPDQRPSGGNPQAEEDSLKYAPPGNDDDPLYEAIQVMKEQGIRFEIEEEEEEDWDDILEDLDDPWMREPAPALFEIDDAVGEGPGNQSGSEPHAADPYSPEGGFREVTANELRLELEASQAGQELPITLIDVRSTVEHAAGSVPGSVHVPLAQLTRDSVSAFMGNRIVVIGSGDDERSRQAFVRLTRVYGFTDVRHMSGGMAEWN